MDFRRFQETVLSSHGGIDDGVALRQFPLNGAASAYLLTILLALSYVSHMYSLDFVAGNTAVFMRGDTAQHVSGWMFFRDDDWRFPLLLTQRMNTPEGISIAFTDSIPLLALPMKLMRAVLPNNFHYIGLWHVVIYLLQSIAAVYLIRALGARTLFASFIAAGFALTWPPLLMRFGHTSLLTHALILFALGVYFLARRREISLQAAGWRFIAIVCVAMMVHPYLMAMCYAVFVAHLVDQAIVARSCRSSVFFAFASLLLLASLAWLLGYLGGNVQATGFGLYSMNLAAPFCGGRLWQCGYDGTGSQGFEGYNYLGAGFFALCLPVLRNNYYRAGTLFKSYPGLISMAVLIFVYALSDRIFVGPHLALKYPLPALIQKAADTFRCSGRFFWVVGYLLLFVVLSQIAISRQISMKIFLLAALSLQIYDMDDVRNRVINEAAEPAPAAPIDWAALLQDIDAIEVYPVYGCDEPYPYFHSRYQTVAALYHKLINTGYVARASNDCAQKQAQFEADLLPGKLYVAPAEWTGGITHLPMGFVRAADNHECVIFEGDMLCVPGRSADMTVQRNDKLVPVQSVQAVNELRLHPLFLPTRVGRHEGDTLVAPVGSEGHLSFGPYRTVSPGRYSVAITLDVALCSTDVAGHWDAIANPGAAILARGDILSNQGGDVIKGFFTTHSEMQRFEIRTYSKGVCELRLHEIALRKLD